MDTAMRMVEILQLDPEDPKTNVGCFTGWWSCNQCPAWMNAMVWEDLVYHFGICCNFKLTIIIASSLPTTP